MPERLQLDSYSEYVSRYEGWGQVHTRAGRTGRAFFDARQMPDTSLIFGCLLEELPVEAGEVFDAREIVHVEFSTDDNSKITTFGAIICVLQGPRLLHFSVERMCVQFVDKTHVTEVRFPLFNFLPLLECPPEGSLRLFQWPISISIVDLKVEISRAVDDDWVRRQRFMPVYTCPTAECSINDSHNGPLDFCSVVARATELLKPLSLAMGARVSTAAIKGLNESKQLQIIIYNNNPPYPLARIITSSLWHPDVPALINAWLVEGSDRIMPLDIPFSAIEIFVDACSPCITLESRCRIACCLLDAVAHRLSQTRGDTTIIPDEVFAHRLAPNLHAAIEAVAVDESIISRSEKDQLISAARGLNRVSFRRRLRAMFDELNIPIVQGRAGSDIIQDITRVRNSLVHEGEFLSRGLHPAVQFFESVGPTKAMGFHDYINCLWACYCALLRLARYAGSLPDVNSPPHYSGASARV